MKQAFSIETAAIAMELCVANAHDLMADAEALSSLGRGARAFMLYQCSCEELAKFYMLEIVGRKLTGKISIDWGRFWKRFRSHDSKMAQAATRVQGLAASADDDTRELAAVASGIFFLHGIQPRNRALYVEIETERSITSPGDVDWSPGIEALEAMARVLWLGVDDVGRTRADIVQRFALPRTPSEKVAALAILASQYLSFHSNGEGINQQVQ